MVLVYEDLSEMAPGVQLAALTGKTDVTCKDGGANLRLRITTVSSAHSKRRFRFKVAPMDVTLAAERPRLIQLSEAFSVVSHTQTVSKPVGPRAAGTGVLTKLKALHLVFTQITDAGCAALAAALDSGSLPALETINLHSSPASTTAMVAVREAVCEALAKARAAV